MYTKAHAAIRQDPDRKPAVKKQVEKRRWSDKKLTKDERDEKVKKAKLDFLSQIEAQRD